MTRTASQNGKRSRTKGHNFERWVVNQLQGVGIACERNLAQSRTAAKEGCDIEGTDWWIECGCGNSVDPRSKYAQAERDLFSAESERPVAVVTKRDRVEPMVTVRLTSLTNAHHRSVGDEDSHTGSLYFMENCGPLVTLRFSDWIELVRPR